MKIAIDCRYIRERPSGIGTYVQMLLERLPALGPLDDFFLWRHKRAPHSLSSAPNVIEQTVPVEPNSLWTIQWPHRYASFHDVDVFHNPQNIMPRGLRCATVVTVHDLLEIQRPELIDRDRGLWIKRFYYPQAMWRALRQATRIITLTQAIADDVITVCPAARSRLVVVPHGVGPPFVPARDRAAAHDRAAKILGTTMPYFLVLGANARRKQQHIALEAFAHSGLAKSSRLVIVQRRDADDRLRKRAQELALSDEIIWLGSRERSEIVTLIHAALAHIQTSIYEGFGLTLLEAMACGCPVIARDIPSAREVIGGAGVLVDDVTAFATSMREIWRSGNYRQELSARGVARAAKFSWDKCAAQTLRVYGEAAEVANLGKSKALCRADVSQ